MIKGFLSAIAALPVLVTGVFLHLGGATIEVGGVEFALAVLAVASSAALCLAGAVPRKVLLGKKPLSGSRLWIFELSRALAAASPVLLLHKGSPLVSIPVTLMIAACILIMRQCSKFILDNRSSLRAEVYAKKKSAGTGLMNLKRANSMVIVSSCVLALVVPVFAQGSSAAVLSLAAVVAGLGLLSVVLATTSWQHKAIEADSLYNRHVEEFIRECLKGGVSDLVHYAGGAPEIVGRIAARLNASGRKCVVIARDAHSHERAERLGLKSFLVRRISDLDSFVLPVIERIHYSGDTLRGGHLIRFSGVRHILHAAEIKPGGFPGHMAMYDAVVTGKDAGEISRVSAKAVGVDLIACPGGRNTGFTNEVFETKRKA